MKITFLFFLILSVSFGCSPTIKTFSDSDQNYPIQKNKTYKWEALTQSEIENYPLYYNELNDKRIKNIANEILSSKGYVLVDSISELYLHYHIVVEGKSVFEQEPYSFFTDANPKVEFQAYQYQEGTLIIDFGKGAKKDLIWRGWGVQALDKVTYHTDDIEDVTRSVVTAILKKLPPSDAD